MKKGVEENADPVIAALADALVANFPSHFSLFCGHCWQEARVSQDADKTWSQPTARAEAAQHFFEIGWRFRQKSICPQCAVMEQS